MSCGDNTKIPEDFDVQCQYLAPLGKGCRDPKPCLAKKYAYCNKFRLPVSKTNCHTCQQIGNNK